MILALQFYEGDMNNAMKLARLLADIEPVPRKDVLLALVCQPGTPFDGRVKEVLSHCSKKFAVEHVVSKYGAKGWADGSGQLWTGTMEHFHEQWKKGLVSFGAIFTFDGGDGVPLRRDWIDVLKKEQSCGLSLGKLVVGQRKEMSGGNKAGKWSPRTHVNGNMILHLMIWDKYPSLHCTPLGASLMMCNTWDMYHADVFLEEVMPSSVICSEWRKNGLNEAIMSDRARHSAWLHGYRDHDIVDTARRFLLPGLKVSTVQKRHFVKTVKQSSVKIITQQSSSPSPLVTSTNPGTVNPSEQCGGRGIAVDVHIG